MSCRWVHLTCTTSQNTSNLPHIPPSPYWGQGVKLAFMIHILSYPLLLWKEQRLLLLLFPSYPIPSILPWHTKLLNIFLHYIHESYVFILFFSCLAPSSTSFVKHIHHSSSTHVQTISDLSHLFLSANHPISENSPDGIFFFFCSS